MQASGAAKITGLYAVTPDALSAPELMTKLNSALAAGVRLIQLRRKQLTAADLLHEAHQIRALTSACDATFIVNDNLAIALEVGADGVHWGRDDAPCNESAALAAQIRNAKRRAAELRPHQPFLIGISCYGDFARAEFAVAAGADYLAFGSMFVSPTKPNAAPASLELLTRAKQSFALPIVAIGGISRDNAPTLIKAGADAVAVISDLFSATTDAEIATRSRSYQALFAARALPSNS